MAARRGYLASARRVPKPAVPTKLPKGQSTLDQVYSTLNPDSGEELEKEPTFTAMSQEGRRGTRDFPRFSLDTVQMKGFLKFLMSIDGQMRNQKVATEMAVDVSKFLKFAGGRDVVPDFGNLLERDMLVAFLDKLERYGCGIEGRISKLDSIDSALSFIQLSILCDNPQHAWHPQVMQIRGHIKAWKATLRKGKTKMRAGRLDVLSSQELTFEEVNKLLENPKIWDDFHACLEKLFRNEAIDDTSLRNCTASIAAILLFKSWSRPGAVMNLTISEYNNHEVVESAEGEVIVLRVKNHKTGLAGSAKLMLTPEDFTRLKAYVDVIRPVMDANLDVPNLLILPGGKPIHNMHNLMESLGRMYQVSIPSATLVRKTGATSLARNVSGPTATLVQNQMAHSTETHARFYRAITGAKDAAVAFHSMEKLRVQEKPGVVVRTKKSSSSSTGGETTSSASPRKRFRFSSKEEEQIKAHFATAISSHVTPSLGACRAFLAKNPMDRSPKQIQDKVKNFIK